MCKNLNAITLHMGRKWTIHPSNTGGPILLPTYHHRDDGWEESDDRNVYEVVGNLVNSIPWLKHLQLGDFRVPGIARLEVFDIGWGISTAWMEYVKARRQMQEASTMKRELGRMSKPLDEKRETMHHTYAKARTVVV
jgi:hypothetical protein